MILWIAYMMYLIASGSEGATDSHHDAQDDIISFNEVSILDDTSIRQQKAIAKANHELSIKGIIVNGFLKIMSTPWDMLLNIVLPKSRDSWLIWLHLIIPLLLIWNVSEIELYILEKLIARLKSSSGFIGLTLMSWGNNTPDMFNVASAMSKGMVNLALNAAIASEIHNILLGLGLPWLVHNCLFNKRIILSSNSDIYVTTISFYCIFLLSFIALLKLNNSRLNTRFAVFLITAYTVFFTLIFILYYKS
jgi:Ca2+/Na+ antiporter